MERKPSALKSVQLDHCNRLQQKYQQDIDLLDDLRLFMRQRAVIEKVYAQSLCKLVQQYLVKRQFPAKNPGESENADSPVNKTLLEVWKNVLDETRNVAMVRLAAAETYIQKISEQCKQVRANRTQVAKLVFEELNSLQKDILMSIQEMNKSQKVYREEEHIAYDARVKATNASNKVKNKSIGRFTSLAKLQQQSSKMNARVEACEVKSTAARNEYILNLRAANAHVNRYHAVDIPDLIQVLDGEYFDVWKHFLTLFTTTELQCSSAVSQCFGRVATDVNKISRQYNTECFMKENPVLTETMQYPFVPQDNDPVTHVCKDNQAELDLDREARKWATKIARENRTIRKTMKMMSLLKEEKNKAISSSMEFLVSPTFATSEIKLEEQRSHLRLAETGKAKAEARIEALREGGVEVDVWLNSANADTAIDEDESFEGNGTAGATKNDSAVRLDHNDSVDINAANVYAQVGDHLIGGGDVPNSPDRKDMIYPIWCVAVYDYQAANEDELTINENENLVLLGQGDGDGWMRARNGQSVEGLVPENYIRVWNPVADSGTIDVNEENVDDGTLVPYAVNNPHMNVIEPQDKGLVPYAVNNSLMNVIHTAKLAQNPMYAEVSSSAAERWARALFDYEATCEEELSFQEGQLIRIISTEHDGVDDGWWEGEVNGSFGLFPSLVVEELLPIRLSESVDRQTPEETPPPESVSTANVYGNLDSVAFQNAHKRQDAAIVFNVSKNQRSADGADKPRMSSPIVQSLFNDGTESAV